MADATLLCACINEVAAAAAEAREASLAVQVALAAMATAYDRLSPAILALNAEARSVAAALAAEGAAAPPSTH